MDRRAKPWQIVLVVACFAALGVSLYITTMRGPKVEIRDSVQMADVETGELFTVKIGPGGNAMVPGMNEKTKRLSLVRVEQRNGEWFVIERDLAALNAVQVEPRAVLDRGTGRIQVQK